MIMNDPGKQPRGLAFMSNTLFYSDSAFDAIMYAPIAGTNQPATFSPFKKDMPDLINIKAFQSKTSTLNYMH